MPWKGQGTLSGERIIISDKKESVLSTGKSFAFLAVSLEEEKKHCLHIIYTPGLLLPTTAAAKSDGQGLAQVLLHFMGHIVEQLIRLLQPEGCSLL